MAKRMNRRDRRTNPAAGLKAMISIGAVAISLIGWGVLGKQELAGSSSGNSMSLVGELIHEILGPLPTLVPHFQEEGSLATSRPRLRSVSAPNQISSGSGFITRTQSSR